MFDKAKLKELGIEDEAVAEKVLSAITQDGEASAKQLEQLTSTIKSHESQLASLKQFEGDNAALKKQIETLEADNKQKSDAYQTEFNDYKRKTAAKVALLSDEKKPHDIELILSLIDMSKVELDDNGKVKGGLKKQIEEIQKARPYLFADEKQAGSPTGISPFGTNQKPAEPEKKSKGLELAQRIIEQRKRAMGNK